LPIAQLPCALAAGNDALRRDGCWVSLDALLCDGARHA